MNTIFNKKILYLIPMIFLIIILLRISYAYNEANARKYDFALKEAEVLNTYAMAHRIYYQHFFINKIIPLSEETLPALPAASSYPISKSFSQNNKFNISIHTVSDRARSPRNQADIDELKAIDFFKKNTDETEYFSDKNDDFYQFAYALRIDAKCLTCHGKKENAPLFIQKNYDKAYDYKVGELRGIQSIKIPTDILNTYFMRDLFNSIIYDIVLFITLFIAIFILIKKSKNINEYLQKQIDIQTKKLKNTLVLDNLTLLPNRLQLLEDIEKAKNYRSTHLALLNINDFKDINDFYGHDTGDDVLKSIAHHIQGLCDGTETFLYKLPSDEFAIFTIKDISDTDFTSAIRKVLKNLHSTQINTSKHTLYITLSAGISSNNNSLLSHSDMALKSAKNSMNEIVLYSQSIDKTNNILENMKGIMLIKEAIETDTIQPYFQPIYNVKSKKIEKYESLIRIVQKDGTVLPPFKFLDIAIKSKLYPKLTKIMVLKSFAFFIDKNFDFSINLSIDDILNKRTTQFIIEQLEKFSDPTRIVFEILESNEIQDYEQLKEFIVVIKKYGCKFAIDDFGSGYSNFSHLLELNIDYLKIDASLVKYVTTDENSRVITKTIIDFASTLGLKTIAEFVEDQESLEALENMGVDYIQGYYIGKPDKNLNTTFKYNS